MATSTVVHAVFTQGLLALAISGATETSMFACSYEARYLLYLYFISRNAVSILQRPYDPRGFQKRRASRKFDFADTRGQNTPNVTAPTELTDDCLRPW